MTEIAIIADDLTGALDSAAQFSHFGRTCLVFDAAPENACAVAVSTASRALSPAQSRAAAHSATASVPADRLFVKIDSTLRGNPAEHLAGALDAWRVHAPDAFAVICPALPVMGREVRDGHALDHGVPITNSAAAGDPISSATSANITDVFPGSVKVSALDLLVAGRNVVVDASTDDDLDRIATAIEPFGADVVAVGSAGLAAAIARRRAALPQREEVPQQEEVRRQAAVRQRVELVGGDTLVLLTSVHPAARMQLAALPDDVTVVSTADWNGSIVSPHDAVAVADEAAVRAAELLSTGRFGSLLIIGGDGAHALLTALGTHSFEVVGELLPGVPIGTLAGGVADGLTVATRSGGFGGPTHLNDILIALKN
jgi:uncharacterized protein YgbK (DUF1537 family)